jgi:3-polyprenyl-4-hydroxybenzoate decarboxylase
MIGTAFPFVETQEGHPRPWPERILMTPEVREKVNRRWAEYGFG